MIEKPFDQSLISFRVLEIIQRKPEVDTHAIVDFVSLNTDRMFLVVELCVVEELFHGVPWVRFFCSSDLIHVPFTVVREGGEKLSERLSDDADVGDIFGEISGDLSQVEDEVVAENVVGGARHWWKQLLVDDSARMVTGADFHGVF